MIQNIHTTPAESFCNEHYFCDYIEILALINNQDVISISDVYDRFKESNDIDEIDINDDDKWNNRINEWFNNIASRGSVFNDFYPFTVSNNNIQLKVALTNKHKLYIFLLLSASQKYIKKTSNTLPKDFEKMSLVVLQNYLPKYAKSYIFGTSSNRYVGTLEEKIKKLAEDLKYKVKTTNFQKNNTGDGGLDLVAWLPFLNDTNQNNMQVFLAQCATGKKWSKKQHEAKTITDHYIFFKTKVNHVFLCLMIVEMLKEIFQEKVIYLMKPCFLIE